MTFTIDRIEGNYLIVELENGKIINLPKELIPNAKENDIYTITLNKDEMKKRKEYSKPGVVRREAKKEAIKNARRNNRKHNM